ncbi:MAG TPA: glycosyltransferase family 4 protein [Candidatus Limnocylindrales bacterium]|nr:glycosyltransferase family 4 protein [Candidatus Limnocylindrales bacterium]
MGRFALHILLLNEYFPPDTSATAKIAATVADALSKRHQVTALAGRPSYDPDERYPFQFLRRDVRGNLTVERVGSATYSRHQMRRRVANYLSYAALAVPRALAIKADLVLAMTDPPFNGIVGAAVARMKRIPFVYNIRDLYPDMALGGDIVRPTGWIALWERMHRSALRQATRVIVLGDDMRDLILSKGVTPERVVVVRDGASVPAAAAPSNHPAIGEIRGSADFVVLHAGNLGFYGAWTTLLDAAKLLPENGTRMIFVGDGANRARLEESSRGSAMVRFLPFRPPEEIPCVMAAGDIHIVTIRRGLAGVVVPSKLYSILAAGRPILAVTPEDTDVARIVRSADCGLVADPDNPAEVAAAIRTLKSDPARLEAMGRRAHAAAADYARVKELEKFTAVIEEAAHPQGARSQS